MFINLGVDTCNLIYNDIDTFILDEEASEKSIIATIQNFDGIVDEHGNEVMGGVLNWTVFEKYL